MQKRIRTKAEDQWLKKLGTRINDLIASKGYKSPYEFWVEAIGDDLSRATLNHILNGKFDPKASSLKKIADALEVDIKEIFNF